MDHGKAVCEAGIWPLYRYDPRLKAEGKNPFQLDAKEPDFAKIEPYMYSEVRFKSLVSSDPARAAMLLGKEKAFRRAQVEGIQVPERADFLRARSVSAVSK